jgi:hypothetical protein
MQNVTSELTILVEFGAISYWDSKPKSPDTNNTEPK